MEPANVREIRERGGEIRGLLERYDRGKEMALLLRAFDLLGMLREAYRQEPAAFAAVLPELKACSKEIGVRLRSAAEALAAGYVETTERWQALAQERLRYRNALVELCTLAGAPVVTFGDGPVRGKKMTHVDLPAKGTPERERLMQLLEATGLEERCLSISPSALRAAIDRGEIAKAHLETLRSLCSIRSTYQIFLLPLGPAAERG
jgi:hypothetical protein